MIVRAIPDGFEDIGNRPIPFFRCDPFIPSGRSIPRQLSTPAGAGHLSRRSA